MLIPNMIEQQRDEFGNLVEFHLQADEHHGYVALGGPA